MSHMRCAVCEHTLIRVDFDMVHDDRNERRNDEERGDAIAHEEQNPREDRYLSAKQVRRRYGGKSDMTIWRWTRDPDLNFPEPDLVIRGQRFWRESRLEAWEKRVGTRRPSSFGKR